MKRNMKMEKEEEDMKFCEEEIDNEVEENDEEESK